MKYPALARRRRKECGVALVEFSLVILPIFALFFITLDLAWFIFAWAAIQEGAREGVRYIITCSGQAETSLDSATKLVVQQYSFGFARANNITINYYLATGYSSNGAPTPLNGTSGATAMGNVVTISVQSSSLSSFGPVFRAFQPVKLVASASDLMQ